MSKPSRDDRPFTYATLAATGLVAVIAAVASYQHIYEVAVRHGQAPWVAALIPFSFDGMIASATMVIWYAARHAKAGDKRPAGAWLVLALGIGATVLANVASAIGADWHWLAWAISAWPAAAFVAAYEMTAWLVRKHADEREAARRRRELAAKRRERAPRRTRGQLRPAA
jgi:hypothetical protein